MINRRKAIFGSILGGLGLIFNPTKIFGSQKDKKDINYSVVVPMGMFGKEDKKYDVKFIIIYDELHASPPVSWEYVLSCKDGFNITSKDIILLRQGDHTEFEQKIDCIIQKVTVRNPLLQNKV